MTLTEKLTRAASALRQRAERGRAFHRGATDETLADDEVAGHFERVVTNSRARELDRGTIRRLTPDEMRETFPRAFALWHRRRDVTFWKDARSPDPWAISDDMAYGWSPTYSVWFMYRRRDDDAAAVDGATLKLWLDEAHLASL